MTAIRDMLPTDRAELAGYDLARERFGGDEQVLVALVGDDHFSERGLARLAALTQALEAHPLVERALSIASADEIRSDGDELRIDPYLRPRG